MDAGGNRNHRFRRHGHTTLVVPPEIATQRQPSITLTPVPTEEPLRISTVIGDFEFTTMQLPTGHSFFFTEATPHGPIATEGFDILRWSTDGVTWDGILPAVDPWRITMDGDDVVVHGDGYARYAWDGASWIEASIVDLPGPAGTSPSAPRRRRSDRHDTPTTHRRLLRHRRSELHKGRGRPQPGAPHHRQAAPASRADRARYSDPPQPQIGPVLATEAGFVVLTPAHPDNWSRTPACEPLLWFSADGNRWDLVSSQSPFGEGAIVHRIAEHAGRYIAVGATPSESAEGAVWVSDDALTLATGRRRNGRSRRRRRWRSRLDGHRPRHWEYQWTSLESTCGSPRTASPGTALTKAQDALGTVYFLPELAVGTDAIYGVGGTHDTYIVGRLQE